MLAELLTALSMLGTQPAAEPTVVWAVGDGANGTRAAKRLANAIRRDRPDRFLYLGDVYERGTSAEFESNYDSVYGALAPITSPTPGNHEWGNRESGYFPYWQRKLGRPLSSWYDAGTAGGWQILSLNSEAEHGSGSSQARWLRSQLGEGDCRIAFWHRPRFNAGTTHGDARDMAPIWNAVQGRAALVLAGHDHDSQRLRRRGGTVQLIAGAGGPNLYPVNRRDRRLIWSDDDHVAALRLELTPGRARFEYRTASGRVLNRGSVRCSPT